ncbi:glycoside hydrolase family 30 beta sandwich domain-containing protein [Massilia sp. 9096]|uniref:glycoside hydrolase family 30 protein n=1 Tax=Massilia sp. 9096 TaxID=1500894 RepID=UPI001EFA7E23|nr:glycoside hydrolase family 30 beta sandwich domain-containing protein [Massilia sp. 9096]
MKRILPRPALAQLAHGAAMLCLAMAGAVHGAADAANAADAAQVWVTTGDQKQLMAHGSDVAFDKSTASARPAGANIDIVEARRYQAIVGFGAALTDASAMLIQDKLSPAQRAALLRELFGRQGEGLGLSFTRLTIGASDFSTVDYSFDDVPAGQSDPQLAHFSIAPNRADVLPVVKAARAVNPALAVMASPWSAPAWMKTTGSLVKGHLKPDAYGPFAQYLLRYVQAYKAEGVPIFALTLQNEPNFEPDNYPGMRVDPDERAAFIGTYLGPALEGSGVKIFDWDHNWDHPEMPLQTLADPKAARYIDAVAWHCYGGKPDVQSRVHDADPGKDVYLTECSGGDWAPGWAKQLQFFTGTLLIDGTRNWARGVLFWNLALDENKGPHLGGCGTCRGVVTIDSRSGQVTRNPEWYALAHVSRFVRPGAQRIASNDVDGVKNVVFRNADDGSRVLVLANPGPAARNLRVRDGARSFRASVPADAVATYVWAGAPGSPGAPHSP